MNGLPAPFLLRSLGSGVQVRLRIESKSAKATEELMAAISSLPHSVKFLAVQRSLQVWSLSAENQGPVGS